MALSKSSQMCINALVVIGLAVGFAMHCGMQVGISNHAQYLLHGMHAADNNFLANDWFTTQTPEHHGLFGWLVCSLQNTGILNIALGLLNGLASTAAALAIYFLAARFSPRPLIAYAAILAMFAFMPSDGPGHSNLLLPYFVPSVFAGVMVLIAFVLLIYGRTLASGIVAAVGCAAHANYLVLLGPVWVIYAALAALPRPKLTSERRARLLVAAHLLGPWVLAWVPHLDMFYRILIDPSPSAVAKDTFFRIYAPLHYAPSTWPARQWTDYFLVIAAAGLAWTLIRRRVNANARRVAAAVAVVVACGAAAIILFGNDFANSVFPWRFAPYLTIAAYVCIGMLVAAGPQRPLQGLPAILAVITLLALTEMDRRAIVLIASLTALSLALWMIDSTPNLFPIRGGKLQRWIPSIATWAVLFVIALLGVRSGLWRQDMFTRRVPQQEAALYDWVRSSTPEHATFAVPPDLFHFRLATGRSVIIDFKCFPLTPTHQLEWKRRQDRQAGGSVADFPDAIQKYAEADSARVESLTEEFGIRYFVIDRRRHRGQLDHLATVFRNEQFEIFQTSPTAFSAAE
ncbi:MAG: hypothetical protein KF841_05860 [Phycisphaerae bacterium]|nr:hypothetical protein [Phycisphaerae bacterium]